MFLTDVQGESRGVSIHELTAKDGRNEDAEWDKSKAKNGQSNNFHASSRSACCIGLDIFHHLPSNKYLGWVITPDISPRK